MASTITLNHLVFKVKIKDYCEQNFDTSKWILSCNTKCNDISKLFYSANLIKFCDE